MKHSKEQNNQQNVAAGNPSIVRKHLHFQISLLFVAFSLILVLLLAGYVYTSSYREQVANVRQATIELMETVAEPATVASYLNQEDMLKDVTNGLAKNSIIRYAKLTTSQGLDVFSGLPAQSPPPSYVVEMALTSPFAKGKVGSLTVVQNRALIERRASRTGWVNALTLIVVNFFVVLFGTIFIYFFLTKPIKKTGLQLHSITPGSDAQLDIPKRHKVNEFGRLISDINYLLGKTKRTIDSERDLRQKVEDLEAKYRRIFEYASGAIVITTPTGDITMANIAFDNLRKIVDKDNSAKKNICKIFADTSLVEEMLRTTVNSHQAVSNDLLAYGDDGSERWFHATFLYNKNEEEEHGGTIEGILYDITERYIQEKESQRQAERDHLTLLYNRQGVENKLRKHLGRRKGEEDITLLMMDLDGFKQINDTYGHDAGDIILVEVARRLSELFRETDTIARWGGDEFIIILYNGYKEEECFAIGKKILESLNMPISLGNGNSGMIGASIGASTLSQNGFDKDRLLKSADKAMYETKTKGKNGICFYHTKEDRFSCKMYRP